MSARPDWAAWPEAEGLSDEQIAVLESVSQEARARGLDVHLPVGDLSECAFALEEAGAEDLAAKIREARS